jgi:hypothetical protein
MGFSDVYNLFFNPGEVTEIRGYGFSRSSKIWEGWAGGSGVVYGYFDNAEDFGRAAAALEKKNAPGSAIYFTINPCIPDLLARAANRLKAAGAKPTNTSDRDILCIRWLPVDIDPKRPAGISSTDAELQLAVDTREKIAAWLKKKYKISGIPAVSGNGTHLMVPLKEMANTDENKEKIKRALHGLAEKFGTDKIDIDLAVFNPARIIRLYGTTARKGDHIKHRPHRASYIEEDK